MVAAQAGVPVVPVALHGTRSILGSGQGLPRRGAVRIAIGESLARRGTDWTAALVLRDGARAAVLRQGGEPALEPPAEHLRRQVCQKKITPLQ
ncbi:MAG: hypothetical protein OEU26_03145 [Candidatus Tectomicrobia bacterium]|nr:hypothetical protein [Candidatus Tectomicrobia bacterium]